VANRSKNTLKRREAFLAELGRTANVTASAAIAGLERKTLYTWRTSDAAFAAQWDEAVELGTLSLEDEAIRRASQGVDEAVFYKGVQCGSIKKYSDTLMIFMLKARNPAKYRDNNAPITDPDHPNFVQGYAVVPLQAESVEKWTEEARRVLDERKSGPPTQDPKPSS
jgi:hypothetical protein